MIYELSRFYGFWFYKRQGVTVYYRPFLGIFWPMCFRGKDSPNDQLGGYVDFLTAYQNSVIVSANPWNNFRQVTIIPHKLSAHKDFWMKENDTCLKRSSFFPSSNMGFVTKNGSEALHQKGIFNEFFIYDKLARLVDPMDEIIKKELGKFIEAKQITDQEYQTIQLSD